MCFRTSTTCFGTKSHSRLFTSIFNWKFYLLGSCFCIKTSSWLLSFSYICSNMFNCYYVLGIFLDKTGSSTSKYDLIIFFRNLVVELFFFLLNRSYIRSNFAAYTFNPTCQITSFSSSCFVFKSCRCFYVCLHYVSFFLFTINFINNKIKIRFYGSNGILSCQHRTWRYSNSKTFTNSTNRTTKV